MRAIDVEGSGGQSSGFEMPSLITAAHELKSPLALMRQLSLGLETAINLSDEQQRILRQIILTSEKALRLTTDLSRSSRLDTNLFELEPLNPQQVCEEVAHELTPLYRAHGRHIEVASRTKPLLVLANPNLLSRIMLNFADNALHYADPSLPVRLSATTIMRGKAVRLKVRDHGPALPKDAWHRLKEALGSGAQLLHTRPQSSGLGLYVASQFAEAMNGHIGASRHQDGVTFYVDIGASTQLTLL